MQLFQLVRTWQLGSVPTSSQGLNQGDAGDQPILLDQESSLLVGQQSYLGGNYGGIGYRPGLILIQCNFHRALRRLHGGLVHADLLAQNSQAGQLIFDILERGENGLPIVGDALVVGCTSRRHCRRTLSAGEQSLIGASHQRPDLIGSREQGGRWASSIPQRRRQINRGIIGSHLDSDQRVLLLHLSLGFGDVRSSLQQR